MTAAFPPRDGRSPRPGILTRFHQWTARCIEQSVVSEFSRALAVGGLFGVAYSHAADVPDKLHEAPVYAALFGIDIALALWLAWRLCKRRNVSGSVFAAAALSLVTALAYMYS